MVGIHVLIKLCIDNHRSGTNTVYINLRCVVGYATAGTLMCMF